MEKSTAEMTKEIENYRSELDQLRKENKELSRSMFVVNEKLRDSERLKGHFISNITNELINPFASILALSENIRHLKEGQISQAHRMAELIFEEAFHLDFQLKNIFSAAMLEAGMEQIVQVSIDLKEFGDRLSGYFHSQLVKKSISLEIRFDNQTDSVSPATFVTDRDKLDLILKNLISNSIKYSPDGSNIDLRFLREKNRLLIEVSDHGKGINPDDRKIIFDRFRQLDEKINSINTGHGLGLSIVQAYAELLDGEVILTERTGGGIMVRASIPEGLETREWEELDDFLLDSETSY